VHSYKNTPPTVGKASKVINVIVKDLVLVQDTGMSMNLFLIHVRNFYPEHFDLKKKYN